MWLFINMGNFGWFFVDCNSFGLCIFWGLFFCSRFGFGGMGVLLVEFLLENIFWLIFFLSLSCGGRKDLRSWELCFK